MKTETTTGEYMLLFRGPHWDRGLIPDQLQQAMDKVMAWFEGLNEGGKIKVGAAARRAGPNYFGHERAIRAGWTFCRIQRSGGRLSRPACRQPERSSRNCEVDANIELRRQR